MVWIPRKSLAYMQVRGIGFVLKKNELVAGDRRAILRSVGGSECGATDHWASSYLYKGPVGPGDVGLQVILRRG